jgi:carboxymethylenebutenolidase
MDQHIIELYDHFTHGSLTRRAFLDRLTELTGSAAAAAAIVPLLQNNYAQAAIVAANDPSLVATRVSYESPKGKVDGYLVRPNAGGKRPAVIVIHENRGLNPHIEDFARRLAKAGFIALAVDMLTADGGTPADDDRARAMIGKLNPADTLIRLAAAVPYLEKLPDSNGKVGAVGFCWGGGMVNRLAAASPDLDAAVAYYGRQIPAAEVPKISAPLMLHYAGLDARINEGIPAYEAALKANNKKYVIHMYDGANHSFNNDTAAPRYSKVAADQAWERTLAFFKDNLS